MARQMSDCLTAPFNCRPNAQNAAAQHVANLAQQRMAMQAVYGSVVMSPQVMAVQAYSSIYTGPRASTQEETDYAEAMVELNKIAPGWKE